MRATLNLATLLSLFLFCMADIGAQSKPRVFDLRELDRAYHEKSGVDRINALHSILIEEVKQPTAPFLSAGGDQLGHDYVIQQISAALGSAVSESGEAAATALRDKIKNERQAVARDVMHLALAFAGDVSVWKELLVILTRAYQECAKGAIGAFELLDAVQAIPDLMEMLRSPSRDRAAVVLERFGVKVTASIVSGEKRCEADKASAIKVLGQGLVGKNKKTGEEIIDAIARIGGPAAKAELERFVQDQERTAGTNELAAKAKEVLSRMEGGRK
jgi:hypothetical protein